MLKYCDSFDHIYQPGEDGNFDAASPLGLLGWSSQYKKDIVVNPGKGRWGTNRLDMAYSPYTKRFSIGRACNTVVVGFAFQRAYAIGSWSGGYPVYVPSYQGGENTFTVGFGYGTFENFRVTCAMTTAQGNPANNYDYLPMQRCGLAFTYTTGDGTGYPAIQSAPYVPVPFMLISRAPGNDSNSNYARYESAFTFLEIYIDVTDYKNGTVKVAVNGTTVHTLTGIVTAAYNGFGDNPADPRAKINTINFGKATTGGNAKLLIDSMYVCDDDGGYNNDFLGDIFVKTAYPKGDGTRKDFSAYINSVQQPDEDPHYSIVNDEPFSTANEADYIQGDQDMIQELVSFDSVEIPTESTIIAVNHRTAARSVASVGTPPPNTLVPLFKAVGNDTVVTNSLAKKFTGWTYQFLDIYWNLVPGFAIDWTAQYIDDSEFGFLLREPIWTGVELEEAIFADEAIDEQGVYNDESLVVTDEVIDE